MALSSVFNTFGNLAYTSSIYELVPKQHLGRASGMVQIADAAARLVSPLLAGVLLTGIGLRGIIILDSITFIVSLAALTSVRFKSVPITASVNTPLLQEVVYGWNYIATRKGLLALLIFFASSNFATSIAEVLVKPLVLTFTNAAALGILLSLAGSGLMLGSILMSVWGGPKKNRILGVLGFEAILGFCLIFIGLQASITLITAAGFVAFFSVPIINGCSQTIWLTLVAPDVHGRVFAVRHTIAWASRPLAYLVAGPLTDKVFELFKYS
ncbi:major facilitator superfamily MFS_1 [Kalymmatonema gypsitolerans NIES-4073]|nr:major facilitator superfamily MFS_1 [Scytonema sp. NIES-4073]